MWIPVPLTWPCLLSVAHIIVVWPRIQSSLIASQYSVFITAQQTYEAVYFLNVQVFVQLQD